MNTEQNNSIKAIIRPSSLAPTPIRDPLYAVKVANTQGEMLSLADPRATRALVALMNQHAVIGGAASHWGGPSAFAEIMSAAHAIMFKDKKEPWHLKYNFVNDAGHAENGIYALRANYGMDALNFEHLKKFRSIESKLTGHGEAHLNPEGVLISNGPLGSGLPQAQGLAMADKLLGNNRLTVVTLSDGGAMEGEAKESFAAIPGLAQKNKLNPFVIIISDNNTKLSGRIDKDSFSMNPTFESLEVLGFKVIKEEQGHNLPVVLHTLEKAFELASNNHQKPVAVWFKTVKGKGVKLTEDMNSGGHGYPLGAYDPKLIPFLQEIYKDECPQEFLNWAQSILNSKPTEAQKTHAPKEKVQKGVAKALIECADQGYPVLSVSADLAGSTGVSDFQKKYPQRTFDLGVAESNMVNSAIGLSVGGFIPVVDTFAQFGISKGNLPLIMAALSQGPVIGIFSHTGFQDAADGASHQATTYFSALGAIPHTQIINLSCSGQAMALVKKGIEIFANDRQQNKVPDNLIYFLGREDYPQNYGTELFEWQKAQVLSQGQDLLLVGTGPTVSLCLMAQQQLLTQGYNVTVVDHPFVNSPDAQHFSQLLKQNKSRILTVEDHQIKGGMGQFLFHALIQSGTSFQGFSLGIQGHFGQSSYTSAQLYKRQGFDSNAIVQQSLKMMLA